MGNVKFEDGVRYFRIVTGGIWYKDYTYKVAAA